MFGNPPYYYRTIRKIVQAFGSLFNNMIMVQYTTDTNVETQRFVVPLEYAQKENYITRLLDNPNLAKPVEITLPRASFEITGYNFDPSRMQSKYNYNTAQGPNGAIQQFQPVPYNIGFELAIYVRNIEDGLQLIEQILPVFTPTYTLTVNYVPQMGISRNLPITLNGVNCSTQYEGDAKAEERIIIWTLSFTAQAEIFPAISNTGSLITSANVNLYNSDIVGADFGQLPATIDLTLTPGGFGTYQLGEFVFQGTNLATATATGTVTSFSNTTHQLVLSNVQGVFEGSNTNVIGATTNATWPVSNTSPNVLLVHIVDGITPANANINSDYGFTTTITEYN